MSVVRPETEAALVEARDALVRADGLLRSDGEAWASADVEQALGLVRHAIDELRGVGPPGGD